MGLHLQSWTPAAPPCGPSTAAPLPLGPTRLSLPTSAEHPLQKILFGLNLIFLGFQLGP